MFAHAQALLDDEDEEEGEQEERSWKRRKEEEDWSCLLNSSSPGNFYSVVHARTPSRRGESPAGFLYVCTERKENCLRMLSSAIKKNKKKNKEKNKIKHVSIYLKSKEEKMFSDRRERKK
jgi:hypothetical protein